MVNYYRLMDMEFKIEQKKSEIDHLESIQNALDIAVFSEDLIQIKSELMEYGFIKKHRGMEKIKSKSKQLPKETQ